MGHWIEALTAVGAVVGPLAGGGGVWAYMSARHKNKAEAPATMLASQADLVAALSEQTKTLLDESAKDRRDLKRRVDKQGTQITDLGRQVAECERKHAKCESNLTEVRAEIGRMLREGHVATYPNGGANVAD